MVTPRSRRLLLVTSLAIAALVIPVSPGGPAPARGAIRTAAPPPLVIAAAGTGGEAIPASSARFDGTGGWTEINGLVLTETSPGTVPVGEYIRLALPLNFEFSPLGTMEPGVSGCDRKASSVSYPSPRVASIRMMVGFGAMLHGPCRIVFGTLKVRPVSGASIARGGTTSVTVYDVLGAHPITIAGSAATLRMVVPSPAWPAITPATGGEAIPRTTAGIGGSGAWTTLTGPVIRETAPAQISPGMTFRLTPPRGFEWDEAVTTAPQVLGCDRRAYGLAYDGNVLAFTILAIPVPAEIGLCRIDFAASLRIRPIDAAATEGTDGTIVVSFDGPGLPPKAPIPGDGGRLRMVTPPPPAVPISLSVASPYLNNGAIDWGRHVDLTTTAPPDTAFSLQVTITDPATGAAAWETLKNATGALLTFRTAADGTHTYRYTPVRNYWYRAVTETSQSGTPRVTVRQTIVIRPIHSGTRRVAAGTAVTFNATVRPVRPELAKANVRFELYRRGGSAWILSRSATVVIDDAGIASYTFTFGSGSWYVRAQAQPTQVNANSFWTPSQYYTAP